jgi:hypothetical protein
MVPTREVVYDSRQMRVETLCANHFYNKDMIDYVREENLQDLEEMFREDIIDQLEAWLEHFIQFKLIHREDVMPNAYEVIGKIKVVVPDGGDGF